MLNRRSYIAAIFFCAAVLNVWLLRSSNSGGVLAGISFAFVCLSVSCFLPLKREGSTSRKAGDATRSTVQSIFPEGSRKTPAAQIVNAFTVDLEDYFHTDVSSRSVDYEQWNKMPSRIESSVHRLLDLLDDHEARATVFVLGWVAQKHPQIVREVARRGHEVACHSFCHRMVSKMTPRVFREDTRMAKQIIEDVTGKAVEGYRAPSFSITPGTEWAFEVLEQLGFTYDSSVHPVWHATYANEQAPRFPYYAAGTTLLEIPITTWRVAGVNLPIGGGAYLRLLPYSYIRRGLSNVNQREWQPVTLYVHPWEIDYLQPAIHTDWACHVRQLWGTRTMEAKLHRLLSCMRFAGISSVYAQSLSAGSLMFTPAAARIPFLAQVS